MSHFVVNQNITKVVLPKSSSLKVLDYRGFTVFEVTENGDIKRKGNDIKI